jgi:hypothetical protein
LLDLYLADRPVTPENLYPIAKALRQIARECDRFRSPVFLNFLRGCDIPTNVVRKFVNVEHTVLTVPLSLDEVGSQEAQIILKEYFGERDFSDSHLVWIDEALSLRMGAEMLAHLTGYLGENFSRLSVWFLCAENGKMLQPHYRKRVAELVTRTRARVSVKYINVPVLHWMDNNRTLAMNWGRRYTFPLRRDWFADSNAYNAASEIKENLDLYRPGAPIQFVCADSAEFSDYLRRREKFITFLFEKVPYHAKRLKDGEVWVGDIALPVPHLENHINDPHTLWCKELPKYRAQYEWLLSDPKTLIRLETSDREDYESRLLADMNAA